MLITIKLGSPVNMTRRRMEAMLNTVVEGMNRAKNAAVSHWFVKNQATPNEFLWKATEAYAIGRDVSPEVSSQIIASAIDEVNSYLNGDSKRKKVSIGPKKKRKANAKRKRQPDAAAAKKKVWKEKDKEWQDILSHKRPVSTPKHKGSSIPLRSANLRIGWDGSFMCKSRTTRGNKETGVESVSTVKPMTSRDMDCESSCVVTFPLLSSKSGCKVKSPIVRLLVGKLSAGQKKILKRLMDPTDTLGFGDSKLTRDEDTGEWFLRLFYSDITHRDARALRSDLSDAAEVPTVTLTLNAPDRADPFIIVLPDGSKRHPRIGKSYEHIYRYNASRKAVLRERNKNRGPGSGHGADRFYARTRPYSRGWSNHQDMTEKLVIADVIKAAKDVGAARIAFRMPAEFLKNRDWFGSRGLPWSWKEFGARMKTKATDNQVAYDEKILGWKEYRDTYRLQDLPEAGEDASSEVPANGGSSGEPAVPTVQEMRAKTRGQKTNGRSRHARAVGERS